jgi:hypothetical protein
MTTPTKTPFLQTHVDRQDGLRINVAETLPSVMRINQRNYITVVDVVMLGIIEKIAGIRFNDDGGRKSAWNFVLLDYAI